MEKLSTYEYCHKRLFNYILLKGYSKTNTYEIYKSHLNTILKRFPEPAQIELLDIQDFAIRFQNDNTRKNVCVVLSWLFNSVYNKNIQWFELPYPKKKKKVQRIYSRENILKVLESITNEKQKAILALIIDCGLRASEPCSILISDCNSKERSIVLRSTKGDQDRVIYPSENVWNLIKCYWNSWSDKPETFLFEGQRKGNPYTKESIAGFLKTHCNKTGVEYLGIHAIRRFCITDSIEKEVPISVMAEKVGHSSCRTIEKHYLIHSPFYLKNIYSPLR